MVRKRRKTRILLEEIRGISVFGDPTLTSTMSEPGNQTDTTNVTTIRSVEQRVALLTHGLRCVTYLLTTPMINNDATTGKKATLVPGNAALLAFVEGDGAADRVVAVMIAPLVPTVSVKDDIFLEIRK